MAFKWGEWSKAAVVHLSLRSLSRLMEGFLCVWALRGSWGHSEDRQDDLGEVSPSTRHGVLLEASCQSGSRHPGSHHTQRGG